MPFVQVVDITFNVWYRISELLFENNDEQVNKQFEPYAQNLINALCAHCRLDEDLTPVREMDQWRKVIVFSFIIFHFPCS